MVDIWEFCMIKKQAQTSQEKWATLILILRQECTQFPILDTVIRISISISKGKFLKQWDLAPMWFLTRYHLKYTLFVLFVVSSLWYYFKPVTSNNGGWSNLECVIDLSCDFHSDLNYILPQK